MPGLPSSCNDVVGFRIKQLVPALSCCKDGMDRGGASGEILNHLSTRFRSKLHVEYLEGGIARSGIMALKRVAVWWERV